MSTFAVRYTQPLLGRDSANRVLYVPGVSVLIRQDGVACDVFADNDKTPLANPVPTGVAEGAAGIDTTGNLTLFLEPGRGYSAVATVGNTSTTFAIPDISLDPLEPIAEDAVSEAMLAFGVATQAELDAEATARAAAVSAEAAARAAAISGLSGTYVPTAGVTTKTGAMTFSRPADTEGAYLARLGGPALAPGGGRGLDLIRESNGSVAINFGCDVRPTDWVIGLDLEKTAADGTGNSHLVLAYDAVKQADILRLASGAHLEFANSVAYPDLTARLTLASYMGLPGSRNDASPMTDMLKINVAATSPVTHFLRCLAPSEKFVVLRTGLIGINLNGSSPTAPLHCVAAGDAVKMDRGGSADTAWAAWTQGSGTGDWRAGLEASDTAWVLYAANGATPTPSAPGTLRLKITQAGVATFNASELALAPAAGGSKTISFGVSAGYLRVTGGITNLAATGGYIELTNGVKAIGQTTTQAVFLIQPPASQTADLLRITASNGTTVLGRFDKLGRLGIRTVAVPLDVDVATSEMIVWLKDTVGAAGMQLRSKDTAGTIVAQDFSKGTAVTAPAGGATIDAEARTAIGQIIAHLQRMGVAA